MYNKKTGHIYFHGAKEGQKIDVLKLNDKASFYIIDTGYRKGDDCPLHIHSVIVFGSIQRKLKFAQIYIRNQQMMKTI